MTGDGWRALEGGEGLLCPTCGKDLYEQGQWLRCRAHFVADIKAQAKRIAELEKEISDWQSIAVVQAIRMRCDRMDRMETALLEIRDYPDGGTPTLRAIQHIAAEALKDND